MNLSAAQFGQQDLVAIAAKALNASGLDPRRLELEVTESLILNEDPATVDTLHGLRKLGIPLLVAESPFRQGHAFGASIEASRGVKPTPKPSNGAVHAIEHAWSGLPTPAAAANAWRADATFFPTLHIEIGDAMHSEWRRAVDRSRAWAS